MVTEHPRSLARVSVHRQIRAMRVTVVRPTAAQRLPSTTLLLPCLWPGQDRFGVTPKEALLEMVTGWQPLWQ